MAEAWTWLALLDEAPAGVAAQVTARDAGTGEGAGVLCAWRAAPGSRRPHREALRCDPAVVAGAEGDHEAWGGPDWAVCWTVPHRLRRPLFDDPAVVAAVRAAMADPGRAAAVTSLLTDEVHWAGGLSAVDAATAAAWPGWWDGDPWARLAPSRRLLVGAGTLRRAALPAGPGTQRHAGAPWPGGAFG